MWVYTTSATTHQGAKTNTDANVFRVKLVLNLSGPYKLLAVGPCCTADTPDNSTFGAKPQ